MQVSPEQQPPQEVALQVHFAFAQVCPLPQVAHATPPVPQARLALPATQAPVLSQQPLEQVVALQPVVTFVQVWF